MITIATNIDKTSYTVATNNSYIDYIFDYSQSDITFYNKGSFPIDIKINTVPIIERTINIGMQLTLNDIEISGFSVASMLGNSSLQILCSPFENENSNILARLNNFKFQLNDISKRLNPNFGYNLQEGLRNFRNILADVDRNPMKILCLGDSEAFGARSSDVLNTSWVGRLRTTLQSKLGNVGVGTYPVPFSNGAYPIGLTSSWVITGTWTYSATAGMCGRYISASGNTNQASLTFTGTSLDLVYMQGGSGASSGVTITIDGVNVTVPNFYNASVISGNVQHYTGLSSGSHTLVITAPASGKCYIEMAIAYNPIATTPKGCYVFNNSTPGAETSWYTAYTTQLINVYSPHLVIIGLGLNDAAQGHSATYLSNMQALISAFKNNGIDVLLLPYYIPNDTAAVVNNYLNQILQQYQLADQNNCALVDIYSRWGKSYTLAQSSGLMGTSTHDGTGNSGSDTYHTSDKGHREISNAIAINLIGQIS